MKKIGRILSLVTIMIMLAVTCCFAAAEDGESTLVLKESYPKNGATGTAVENMGVKLYFDSEFTSDKLKNANSKAVKLYDEEGKSLPTRVLYSTQEPGVVLVLYDYTKKTDDTAIKQSHEYTFKLSGDFRDDKGNTLGKEQTISFKTLNQNANMAVNTLMMFAMFGGMMVLSARSAKKQAQQQQTKQKEEKVNPYKEAKKTGKSVEEIVEKDQREKAKKAARAAKKAAVDKDNEAEEEYYDDGSYRVKGPRPISAAGGKYVTGRKAAAEAKRAEEERRKAQQHKAKKK